MGIQVSVLGHPDQVLASMPPRAGDSPKRREVRADAATRAGLLWTTSPDHRYLVKEPDGRYGRWSSVAGVLFELERKLSDVRLVLEKVAKEGRMIRKRLSRHARRSPASGREAVPRVRNGEGGALP